MATDTCTSTQSMVDSSRILTLSQCTLLTTHALHGKNLNFLWSLFCKISLKFWGWNPSQCYDNAPSVYTIVEQFYDTLGPYDVWFFSWIMVSKVWFFHEKWFPQFDFFHEYWFLKFQFVHEYWFLQFDFFMNIGF